MLVEAVRTSGVQRYAALVATEASIVMPYFTQTACLKFDGIIVASKHELKFAGEREGDQPVMGKYRVFRVKYLSNIVTDEYFKYPNIRGKYLNTVQISTNLC